MADDRNGYSNAANSVADSDTHSDTYSDTDAAAELLRLQAEMERLQPIANEFTREMQGRIRPAVDADFVQTERKRAMQSAAFVVLGPYGIAHGPPFLRCCPSTGQTLLHAVDAASEHLAWIPKDAWADDGQLHVWIQWGDTLASPEAADAGPCSLVLRSHASELARAESAALPLPWHQDALSVAIKHARLHDGELLAELRWGEGRSRYLHVIPPRLIRSPLPYSHCLHSPHRTLLGERKVPPVCCTIDRGFGIELELLTETEARHGWALAMQAARDDATSDAEPPWLLERLGHWQASVDNALVATHSRAMSAMLDAWRKESTPLAENGAPSPPLDVGAPRGGADAVVDLVDGGAAPLSDAEGLGVLTLLLSSPGVDGRTGEGGRPGEKLCSEYRSPLPPRELSFAPSARAADEIQGFVRVLRRAGACAANTVCESGNSCTAVHVHVNVRNERAAGPLLSAAEMLAVWVAWVRFDRVTARLARPWMWCEPSCTPLFATGPEMEAGNGAEAAHCRGSIRRETGRRVLSSADAELMALTGADVPAFVAGVHEVLCSAAFRDAAEESERVAAVFGELATAPRALGRYCSINLESVRKHGTLEFRRFHGTLDATAITCWAAICVSFVERFRSGADAVAASVFRAPLAEGLAALRELQERATLDDLRRELAAHVDDAAFAYLVGDASSCRAP